MTDLSFEDKVDYVVEHTRELLKRCNIEPNSVEVNFDLTGTASGTARSKFGLMSISYNMWHVNNKWDEFSKNTIAHEVAHIAEWVLYKKFSHSARWKRICLSLGGNGLRCHSMGHDPKLKRNKVKRCVWICAGCSTSLVLSKRKDTSVRKALEQNRKIWCNRCKTPLTFSCFSREYIKE